ncbi:MAG: hypothetical protein KAX11_07160 [Candidatus Aminicenantes bacterium]|nr:hypothetical protein [Candidatus Aminicenantes bacterium]
MWEAILIIACFVSGFLTRGLYDSIRKRRRKPRSLKEIIEDAMKAWKRAFTELNGKPIDAEYRDGKIHIKEVSNEADKF